MFMPFIVKSIDVSDTEPRLTTVCPSPVRPKRSRVSYHYILLTSNTHITMSTPHQLVKRQPLDEIVSSKESLILLN